MGASIAGPTAAYWFAKAGASVVVIERFPQLRTNGQNVDIRTAGVTVMRKMPGMEEAVRAKATPMKGISFVNANGQPIGTIKATGNSDQQSLVSEYEIFRGDLARILFDLTKDNENIEYVFDEQITSMQQHEQMDGPITVRFANGFPTSEFDLVVACDGATSTTRAIGLGHRVRDCIKPGNCWSAYFSIPQDLLDKGEMGQAYSAVGGRFIGVGPDPSGINRVVLMAVSPSDDRDATQSFRKAAEHGTNALKQFVARYYEGAGWKCDEAIKGMMDASDFYASEMVQVQTPSLFKGRFVMVGDAGYAGAVGTGTSLAMVGAYVLAGEVGKHGSNLATALQAYEQQMRPMINDLQKIPPLFPTMLAPQTAWGIWLRNKIFALICWTRIVEFGQAFFAGAFANADRYRVPDYE